MKPSESLFNGKEIMWHKRFWILVFLLFLAVCAFSYWKMIPSREDHQAAQAFLEGGEDKLRKNYRVLSSASQQRSGIKRVFLSPVVGETRSNLFAAEAKKSVLSLYYEEKSEKLKAVEDCEEVHAFFRGGKGFLPIRLPVEGELLQIISAKEGTFLLSDQEIVLMNLSAKAELLGSKDALQKGIIKFPLSRKTIESEEVGSSYSYTVPFLWEASVLRGKFKESKWRWNADALRVYSPR
jgi:hypothetical protein